MRVDMSQCICTICGARGGAEDNMLPVDCTQCGSVKAMHLAAGWKLLPLTHEGVDTSCNCDQCVSWFMKPGTVTNREIPGAHGEEVELVSNSGLEAHNQMVDFLVGLGPDLMYFITALIHTNETLTYSSWAKRIRDFGPIEMYSRFHKPLTASEIEALAVGVEGLGVGHEYA